MNPSVATAETLLTAEAYRLLPDNGHPTELVRGRIVNMNVPALRHAYHVSKIDRIVGNFVEEHDLGWIFVNGGVVTEHDPDSVRGPDVLFYSYNRLPKGDLPPGYGQVAPELVFEVRSPRDHWPQIHNKVAEYHAAGVIVACVLDPQTQTLTVYRADQPPQRLSGEEEFALPDLLGDFRVPVRRFF